MSNAISIYEHDSLMSRISQLMQHQQYQQIIDLLIPYQHAIGQQATDHQKIYYYYLGIAYAITGQFQQAIHSLREAISFMSTQDAQWLSTWQQLAQTHQRLEQYLPAIAAYEKISETFPQQATSVAANYLTCIGRALYAAKVACNWQHLSSLQQKLIQGIEQGGTLTGEIILAESALSPALKLKAAQIYSQSFENPTLRAHFQTTQPKWTQEQPLCIGFLGNDFYQQATSYLLIDTIESHDRLQFKMIAYDNEANTPNDSMHQRCLKAFDAYIPVAQLSDQQLASRIQQDGVHILLNMKDPIRSRNHLLAMHPAAIQIQYLYYPSSSGASYLDYFIADEQTVPITLEHLFQEKILRIEGCYQPNDRHRVKPTQLTRADLGWQEDWVVMANFNQNYKTTPEMFDLWCQLLHLDEKRVLVLLHREPEAAYYLKKEAQKRHIDPLRLLFCPAIGTESHLSRLQLVDLVLDSYPYGGHTLTSDALWAGTPVVTLQGEEFASRVAASLLQTVGLSELIAHSFHEYMSIANQLLNNAQRRKEMKNALINQRETSELFDGALYARRFESLLMKVAKAHFY